MAAKSPPVIMIHGAFCGGWAFDGWSAPFADAGYAVHSPSLRHHDGNGQVHDGLGETSLADYADDLEALIDGLGEAPILIGHSMGGLLAQMLAARTRTAALVLIAPSAPWGVLPSTAFEVMSAQALYLAGVFWRKALRPERWIASSHALDRLDKETHDAVLARMVPESGLAMFEIFHWAFDAKRTTHVDPQAVNCPVLCFSGSEDRINPPGTVRGVASRYGAEHRELEGFSHWPMAEPGWETVVAEALDWLAQIGPDAVTAKNR